MVQSADAALRDYQAREGTVDLSLEAVGMLNKLTEIETQLSELELKQEELIRLYTEDQSLVRQSRQLRQERDKLNQRLKKLPGIDSQFLTLSRDAKVVNEFYKVLLKKSQELKVVEAGVTGNVRNIDDAFLPRQPAAPNRALIVLIATVLGFIAARQAGTNFLVVRANTSSQHEVELTIKRLQQNNINLTGAIFNGLELGPTSYDYTKYGYQAYRYKWAKA